MLRKTFIVISIFLIFSLLAGCAGNVPMTGGIYQPTVNPVFDKNDLTYSVPTANPLESTPAGLIEVRPTRGADLFNPVTGADNLPTRQPTPTLMELPTSTPDVSGTSEPDVERVSGQPAYDSNTQRVTIYDDQLSKEWQVYSPGGMTYAASRAITHSGTHALRIDPNQPDSLFYFTMQPGAKSVFPRKQVVGIDLWIYSGEKGLGLYDLGFSAIGSNDYTTYIPGDRSGEMEKPYEKTWLYYLNFNENIPPNTWINVQIWLDNMLYDPHYEYVTGFFITNRFNYKTTFYVDDVSLVMSGDWDPANSGLKAIVPTGTPENTTAPTKEPSATRTPRPTATPTATLKPGEARPLPTVTRTPMITWTPSATPDY